MSETTHQRNTIIKIDSEDEFIMGLIYENMDKIMKSTSEKELVKRVIDRYIDGFIIIDKLLNKYIIVSLLIFRPEIVKNSWSIVLLYGIGSYPRERLIHYLLNYLKELYIHES